MAGGWGTPERPPKTPDPKVEQIFKEFELAGFPQPGRIGR